MSRHPSLFLSPIVFLGLFFSLPSFAKISASLPAGRSGYELIDRLESYGCAYPTFRQLQPQPYLDLSIAIIVPREDDEEDPCDAPEWLLRERDILARPALPASVQVSSLVVYNDATPLLGTSAAITPLIALREGRPTFNGPNLFTELNVNGQSGDRLGIAFSLTPGFVGALDDYRHANGRFYLQEGYVKGGYGWLEATFGRTALRFGATRNGGLLLSGAAAPVDLVKLAIRPVVPPSPLSFLGPVTLETWLADQGTEVAVPHTRLWAVALGLRPTSWLELAFLELFQFGGNGAPSLGAGDLLRLFFLGGGEGLDGKRRANYASHFSIWAFEKRVRAYGQFAFQTLEGNGSFSDKVSWLGGLWFPRLGSSELRLEVVQTAPGAYQDGFWKQGLVYKGTPLGHPLGPDGQAAYLDFGFPPFGWWRPELHALYEKRAKSRTGATLPETRYGVGLSLKKRWVSTELEMTGIYSYVENSLYQKGDPVNALGGLATLRYTFF